MQFFSCLGVTGNRLLAALFFPNVVSSLESHSSEFNYFKSQRVENYPGFPECLSTGKLAIRHPVICLPCIPTICAHLHTFCSTGLSIIFQFPYSPNYFFLPLFSPYPLKFFFLTFFPA